MLCLLPSFYIFSSSGAHRDLHSFPTRRSSDLVVLLGALGHHHGERGRGDDVGIAELTRRGGVGVRRVGGAGGGGHLGDLDRKSTRLNSSHVAISYAVFCLKKKKVKKY